VPVKVLITGSEGFVARYFRRALEGHDLTLVDVRARPSVDARDFFRRDDTRFDLVVHLAAVVGGRATIEGEPLRVAVDLAIDAELFQWALRTRPGRVVYYSSSAVYPVGLQTGDPPRRLRETDLDLDDPKLPDLTYGWAKLTGEQLARYAAAEGLRVHVFRPFSGYAEDQDESYPFRAFVDRARRRADPFEIWGDGTQVRDWVHIEDVVAGTLAALEDEPRPLNLCTGRATSFTELARLATAAAGYDPRIEYLADAPRGVSHRVGDPSAMFEVYRPRISLEESLRGVLR